MAQSGIMPISVSEYPSMFSRKRGASIISSLCRSFNEQAICLAMCLVAFTGWLLGANQVGATLWPKARICFNSMSNSFQSECVYCDSRQYANTISACTGQPILATNITQAQAFCIATACLQQTGKQPVVLGRRKRGLQFRPLALAFNKGKQGQFSVQKSQANVTAQFDKSINGTTKGNVAFVLNRPQAIWMNPLTRVLTRNTANKNIQWQFGLGTQVANTANAASPAGSTARPTPPAGSAAAPAPAAPAKPPAPAAPAAPAKPTTG